MYIKFFKDISKKDVAEVGGKGASLGELTQAGIPVPPGFVITADTYRKFVNDELPVDVVEEILQAFDELKADRVAVRSSAIAEDSKTTSWAGQLESYLNVSRADLIDSIRKCWHSIRSERVLAYTAGQNLSQDQLVIAVVIQKMVDPEVSGVMFTQNPVTKNEEEIMVEAGFGLGEMLVQGVITPDNFVVDKNTLEIKSIDVQTQERMLTFKDGKNREVSLSNEEGSKQTLTDLKIQQLAGLGKKIEKHFAFPQDIEWALEKGQFYILQSRPITA